MSDVQDTVVLRGTPTPTIQPSRLSLQFDQYHLGGLFACVLKNVPFCRCPRYLSPLAASLSHLPVCKSELRLNVRQEDSHSVRVLVFLELLVRFEVNAKHAHGRSLELHLVVFRVNRNRVSVDCWGRSAAPFNSTRTTSKGLPPTFSGICLPAGVNLTSPALASEGVLVPSGIVNFALLSSKNTATASGCSASQTFPLACTLYPALEQSRFQAEPSTCFASTFTGSCARAVGADRHKRIGEKYHYLYLSSPLCEI